MVPQTDHSPWSYSAGGTTDTITSLLLLIIELITAVKDSVRLFSPNMELKVDMEVMAFWDTYL